MSNPFPGCDPQRYAEAVSDFYTEFRRHCTKRLESDAELVLAWVVERTVVYAICVEHAVWNADAEAYLLPKIGEFASQVQNAPEDPATSECVRREADDVVERHRHGQAVVWCKGYPS